MTHAPKVDQASDDLGLLQELLTAPSPERSRLKRPAQLKSINQERHIALKGYRFRSIIDTVLVRFERILIIVLLAFFGYWFFDGYGRDWWHNLRNPATTEARVNFDQIEPGASAAEIDQAFGSKLPFVEPSGAPLAQAPDYLVPAQKFDQPAPTPTPTPEPLNPVPLRMVVPRMELDSPVKEVFLRDGAWEVADYAVGFHHGSAAPGTGNTVTAGHAGLRGGVFARLGQMQIGDDIYLENAQTRFHYQVQEVRSVWPNEVQVMYPTAESILTMITCTAWDTQRLVVKAKLVDQAPLSS